MNQTAPSAAQPDSRRRETLLFALQWLIAGIAVAVATPVALGPVLGLDTVQVAAMVQRTLIVSGAATLMQTMLGHRMPIQEGPAGIWTGVILVLVAIAPAMGKELGEVRADVQLAVFSAGAVLALMGALRMVRRVAAMMTPLVTGSFLLLLCLQVSGTFLRGMAGVGYRGGKGSLLIFLLSLASFLVVNACMYFGRGLVRSLAVLIGLVTGWALFVVSGAGGIPQVQGGALVRAPELFAWGLPTLDPGVMLLGAVTGLLGCINLFGAMAAITGVTGQRPELADHDRGGLAMGLIHLLSGVGSTSGVIVLTHSAALVGLMGPACMAALRLSGAAMALLGFFPAVADVFSALPAPVSYATLFALFSQVAGISLKSLSAVMDRPRTVGAAGIGLMVGVATMLLPADLLALLPPAARYLISNGVVVGTLTVMVLQAFIGRTEA